MRQPTLGVKSWETPYLEAAVEKQLKRWETTAADIRKGLRHLSELAGQGQTVGDRFEHQVEKLHRVENRIWALRQRRLL